ncbi:MAG TPA: primosomal protein N' [Steroidobacteraceae bacterium]|nr:primosomal protein N' [Steroidobacteraceae bacterium]
MTTAAILRIALDTPLRRLFDYLPPPDAPPPKAGARVRVPFGRQRLVGVVVAHAAESDLPADKLKVVLEVLDDEPVLDARVLELAEWASQYYHHPLGEVISAALPKLAREGAPSRATTERWFITPEGSAALTENSLSRAKRQRELLERVAAKDGIASDTLAATEHDWRTPMRTLVSRGFVSSADVAHEPAPEPAASELVRTAGPPLSGEQRVAVDAIDAAHARFTPFLLYGITGSGKTEVYLHTVEHVLRRGRRALVLVPEIGLTPQLVARFRERFVVPVAVLHSALTDTERLAAWRQCVSGEARIVLGTRSAVFAPVNDLGIVIVDEEHDASFKQHESGFRYSARDLAVLRAQRAQVPVVLGSATPALETLQNVATGRFTRLSLPRRAGQALPPRAAVVDLREHAVRQGISTPAVEAMQRHLADGSQVLVYINRRGYSPTLACTACGWMAPCRDCDARLTVHLGAARLRCHHCGADAPLPRHCPQCGYAVKHVGQGTERVEETLGKLFPEMPIVRLDRDVVRKRGDLENAVSRINSGEARILVGTQMVTKGHDFPNVTLVVVLNADQGLFSTDFRAPERVAQSIIQVAGRAGRGNKPGDVLIQTEYPEHPLLVSLLEDGYDGFARTALAERAAAGWPPFAHVAVLRASSVELAPAIEFLRAARTLARPTRDLKLLGPAPAAMARRAGRHHAQLLLEARERGPLHRLLGEWLAGVEQIKTPRDLRWSLDVDPLDLF